MRSNNLAFGKQAAASSEEVKQDSGGNVLQENLAGKAVDGLASTRWCAADETVPQTWQVDLGQPQHFAAVDIDWEKEAAGYTFAVEMSADGTSWQPLATTRTDRGQVSSLRFDPVEARHLRIQITGTQPGSWASISEVEIKKEAGPRANPYYDIIEAYRLVWMDVPYAPGQLKTIAYKDGQPIGEASVTTAGPATSLRLTPDRSTLTADGMDLCYVTVEMLDAKAAACPLAMDTVTYTVDGPATLAGVGNGDQMGMDSLTDNTHPLFYGKAVAVLRSRPGQEGTVTLNAKVEGLPETRVAIRAQR